MFRNISLQNLLRFSTTTLPHSSIVDLLRHATMLHDISLGQCLSGMDCPLGVLRQGKIKNVRGPSKCISMFALGNPLNNVVAYNTCGDEHLATFALFRSLRTLASAISSLRVNIACIDMGILFDVVANCSLLVRLCLEESINVVRRDLSIVLLFLPLHLSRNTQNTLGSVRRPWNFGGEWSRRLAQLPRLTVLAVKTCAPTLTIFGERLLEGWFQSSQAVPHPSLLSITVWQTGRGQTEDCMMTWHRTDTCGEWGDCAMDTPGVARLLFV